jgi:hypothetical protein
MKDQRSVINTYLHMRELMTRVFGNTEAWRNFPWAQGPHTGGGRLRKLEKHAAISPKESAEAIFGSELPFLDHSLEGGWNIDDGSTRNGFGYHQAALQLLLTGCVAAGLYWTHTKLRHSRYFSGAYTLTQAGLLTGEALRMFHRDFGLGRLWILAISLPSPTTRSSMA